MTEVIFCVSQDASDHSEMQAKIRRVIEQGHIDDEDFKGVSVLPAMNVLFS